MRPHRQRPRSELRPTCTTCPRCGGCGAVAYSRVAVLSDYGPVWAYEAKPCAGCDGAGWLHGLVPPM